MAELLVVPLKKSSDVDLVKPLKNLIQSTYNSGESSEDYSDALNELSRMRSNAIWKVFEDSSLDDNYRYYDQLVALESKVPPHEVQVPFKWKDAFDKGSIFGGRMSLTVSSLAFERVCVLFNVAALQSAAAAGAGGALQTDEQLQRGARLLQQAAGAFLHLRAAVPLAVHQDTTPDLRADTLDALHRLMLAQAQEVIARKCIRDDMNPAMVAKVCAHAEDLYADALRLLQKESLRALWDREWPAAVQAKLDTFRGLAQYHQAAVARAAKLVGEEIARLQWAVELLGGEAAARAARALAAAVRDNDFIYHERVPERAALEPVPRAPVAKALPVPPAFAQGRDLFAGLVPLAVRGALQAADARRADMLSLEVSKLRDATQLLNSILASLNLPACLEADGDGEGALPDSIREKAAAVRAAGGAPRLELLLRELPDLLQRNRDILDESERMLREEEEADASLRAQWGARWGRTPSERLTQAFRANRDKYRQIIDNAVRADDIVRDKLAAHREGIDLLSRGERELSAGVPAAPDGGAPDGAPGGARAALAALMREVDALKGARDALEAELKDVTVDLRATFLEALHASGCVDEGALSAGALGAALRPLAARVQASLAAQEALAARLQAAHAALPAGGGARAERDAALRRLAAAHDAFQELNANLTEGTKFYNDLTQLLVAYQNKVSDFCFARKTEKEELMKDLTQEASRPAPPPPALEPTIQPSVAKKEPPPRPPPPAAAPAALPYPTQPQGMPLPSGGAGGAYGYYAAPMPAMYNPYATLPYPHHAPRMPPAAPYQPYQYPQYPGAPQPGAPPPPGYNPYPQQ